jgi:hypothetical protein
VTYLNDVGGVSAEFHARDELAEIRDAQHDQYRAE